MEDSQKALKRQMFVEKLLVKQMLMLKKAEEMVPARRLKFIKSKRQDEFYQKRDIILAAEMDFRQFWTL